MAIFAVSFRIGEEADHQNRYNSLTKKIVELAVTYPWQETTSFYVMEFIGDADSLVSRIYLESDMSTVYDKLLVINLSTKEYATRGDIDYPNSLNAIMVLR